MRRVPITLLVFVLLTLLAPPARAQSLWVPPPTQTTFDLELQFPSFDDVDLLFPSFSANFCSWIDVGPMLLVAELPMVLTRFEGDDTYFDVGNPYVGVQGPVGGDFFLETGVHLPLVGEEDFGDHPGYTVGILSDLDRWEAYFPDYVPVTFALNAMPGPGPFRVRVRAASHIYLPLEEAVDTEVFGHYALQLVGRTRALSLAAGFSGRLILTGNDPFETFAHQFVARVGVPAGTVRPGFEFRVPFGDAFFGELNWTLGLGLEVALPS